MGTNSILTREQVQRTLELQFLHIIDIDQERQRNERTTLKETMGFQLLNSLFTLMSIGKVYVYQVDSYDSNSSLRG